MYYLLTNVLTQGSNSDTLSWARRAKPACEPAPSTAPPGRELATFAGAHAAG